jgi:hypothetical protein
MKSGGTFSPIKQLLEKLILSPEVNSKPRKIAFNVHGLSIVA